MLRVPWLLRVRRTAGPGQARPSRSSSRGAARQRASVSSARRPRSASGVSVAATTRSPSLRCIPSSAATRLPSETEGSVTRTRPSCNVERGARTHQPAFAQCLFHRRARIAARCCCAGRRSARCTDALQLCTGHCCACNALCAPGRRTDDSVKHRTDDPGIGCRDGEKRGTDGEHNALTWRTLLPPRAFFQQGRK